MCFALTPYEQATADQTRVLLTSTVAHGILALGVLGKAGSHYSWKTDPLSSGSVPSVLGEELRKSRLAAGLSQEELAFRAGIARNYVSLLELNQKSPTLDTFFLICRALGVRPSTIIRRIEGGPHQPRGHRRHRR